MAKLTLKIVGDVADAQSKIGEIQTSLTAIEQRPIQIRVEASGMDAVTRDMIQYARYTAQAQAASARLAAQQANAAAAAARQAQAEARLGEARERTATATQQRLAEEARLSRQMEATATAEEQSRRANTELSRQIEQTATAEAQLAVQQERTATSAANLALQQERTTTAVVNLQVQEERSNTALINLATQEERTATAAINLEAAQTRAGNAAQESNRQFSLAGDILSRITWRAINAGIDYVAKAFRDALTTMREVDTELTNIQKVSNMTSAELNAIGDAAYSTASKYGVAADEYLSAVYTFQKAGLGDSATEMAELATKTMLVGDTTADVASKFLVAVNAAWQLGGSIETLSAVVDEADYINNNYATDLEKLSAGMPIVASTAANLNMSIEETLAVLGTITSATQETGTKAATAWRALVMNITGEIGEITDETGETIEVTEESVKSISDALRIYGNDAVKAAQETGQLVNPMEAVISLAEAYKDGLLTDIELENILMGVGGKLRTNQLTALVRDLASETSTYYDIMSKLPDAAGTADAEVDTMLSSWESKTQILQNTWTEFFTNYVSSDMIKTALTGVTTLVEGLDTAFGRTVITVGVLTAAIVALSSHPVVLALVGAVAAAGAIGSLVKGDQQRFSGARSLPDATSDYLTAGSEEESAKKQEALVSAVAEAESNLAAARQELSKATNRYNELSEQYITDSDALLSMTKEEIEANDLVAHAIANAQGEMEQAQHTVDAYTVSLEDANAALNSARTETDYYTLHISESLDVIDSKSEEAAKAHKEAVGAMVDDLLTLEDELADAKAAIEAFGEATQTEKGDTFTAYAGIYEKFLEAWEAGLHGSNTVKAAIEAILGPEVIAQYAGDWEAMGELLASDFWKGVFAESGENHGVAFMNALSEIANEYGNVVDESGRVVASFKEVDDSLVLTGYDLDGLADMLGTTPDLLTALIDAWDIWSAGLVVSKDEMLGLADALGALNGVNTVDVTAFLQGLADSAENYSSSEIWDLYNALENMSGVNLTNVPEDIAGIISKAEESKAKTNEAKDALEDLGDEDAEPTVGLDTTKFDKGVQYIEETLKKLSGTPTVITITTKEIDQEASGTDYAEGGPTLVNEEGPEIIQEGGTARIAGDGRPTITNVERGARIFTAEETERILSGYSSLRFFRAAAMGRPTDTGTGNRSANLTRASAAGPKASTYYGSNYTSAASTAAAAAATAQAASAAAAATSAIEDAQKEIEERYKTELDLLKSQLELMEKQGASAEERAAKIAEIQNSLHSEAEELRGIGASETDINKISSEWWDYLEDKQEAFIDEYEDEIKLKESELSLMEAQGVSEDERAAKIAEIQELLHEEAEYMRSIGYSQAEINGLSEKWLDLQKEKIELLTIETEKRANIVTLREAELSFLEASDASIWSQISKTREIQDALHDEAEAIRSTAAYQEAIRQQQEDETKLTDEQVTLLNRVTGLSTEWWKHQSKITELLEESDDALDRIVERYEELEDYYSALIDEAEEERISAFQTELDLLKAQKEEIDDAREEEEKLLAVEKARIALENAQKERNVRQYNAATGMWEWVANAQTVAKAREDLAKAEQALNDFYRDRSIKALEANISTIQSEYDDLRDAIKEFVKGIKDGTLSFTEAMSYFTSRFAESSLAGLASTIGSGFASAANDTVLEKMKANSAAWWSADEKTRQDLANQNYALGTAQGWHRGDDGVWYDASGKRVYDSGGILRGVGGVKATRDDEMILPPKITSRLLAAEKDGAFDALLGHLGIVTAAANGYAGFSGSVTTSSIGTQMNGDTYRFGNITLSENQARGMTVYDLAQMARGLSLHSVS